MIILAAIRSIGVLLALQLYFTRVAKKRYAILVLGWLVYALSPLCNLLSAQGEIFLLFYAISAFLGAYLLVMTQLTYFRELSWIWFGAGALLSLIPMLLFAVEPLQAIALQLPIYLQTLMLVSLVAVAIVYRRAFQSMAPQSYPWLVAIAVVGLLHALGYLFVYNRIPETYPYIGTLLISALLLVFYIHVEDNLAYFALQESQGKLKSTNRLFNTVLESLTYPFYVVNVEDYSIEIANPAALRGRLERNQPCYMLVQGISQACKEKGLPCVIETIKRSRQPEKLEFSQTRGTETRIIEVHGYPIFDHGGSLVQVIQYHFDITERKRAEDALRKRDREIGYLYEAGSRLSATLDLDAVYKTVHTVVAQVMPCDGLFISAYDPQEQNIRCLAAWSEGDRMDVSELPSIPLEPEGQGTQSRVIRSGESLLLGDYQHYMQTAETRYYVREDGNLAEDGEVTEDAQITRSALIAPLKLEGQVIGAVQVFSYHRDAFRQDDLSFLEALLPQISAAVANARLFQQAQSELARRERAETGLQNENRRTRLLLDNIYQLGSALDMDELLQRACMETVAALQVDAADVCLYDASESAFVFHTAHGFNDASNLEQMRVPQALFEGLTSDWRMPVILTSPQEISDVPGLEALIPAGVGWRAGVVMVREGKLLGLLSVNAWQNRNLSEGDLALLRGLADQVALGIELYRLISETQQQAAQMKLLYDAGLVLNSVLEPKAQLENLFRFAMQALNADRAEYWSLNEDRKLLAFEMGLGYQPGHLASLESLELPLDTDHGVTSEALHKNEIISIPDVKTDARFIPVDDTIHAGLWAPVRRGQQGLGALAVFSENPHAFGEQQEQLLELFANQAAVAIENTHLFAETRKNLEHLLALRRIDQAITSGLDLRLVLDVILEQTQAELGVDAASILLFNPQSHTLEFAANRGFQTSALKNTFLSLGEGHAGQAALQQRMVFIPDLAIGQESMFSSPRFLSEGFVSYFAVPLIAKGKTNGVMEIFHRTALHPRQDWLDFLDALARQAAISIESARLYDNLQRANFDLTLAYDATLEGWARALDLRDRETEGHTQRVTQLTLQLARSMRIHQEDLVHIRRGALLHDIGKMGIPDRILHKPGPLDEAEWEIMHQHPVFAFQMLSPIEFLRAALDIPYAHHEKWDGSGYPRGLRGEAIPISARVFAVVDVWDALLSDRPYRKAWEKQRAIDFIRSQSGIHFDPSVVEAFLALIEAQVEQESKN